MLRGDFSWLASDIQQVVVNCIGESPQIVVEPAALTHVRSGEMFVLSCQAVGRPVPRIHWLLDGQRLPRDHNMPRRIAAFQSGTPPSKNNVEMLGKSNTNKMSIVLMCEKAMSMVIMPM